MYFPADPLLGYDPILGAVPGDEARRRLVARFDLASSEPEWALAFEWDIVLRGQEATSFAAGPSR